MAITKTQINYLEQKLRRIGQEKIDKFKEEHKPLNKTQYALKQIKAGKVKLLPKSEIIKKFETLVEGRSSYSYYYDNPSLSLDELLAPQDAETIRNQVNVIDNEIAEFSNKVKTAIQNALDKIVLEGVDVDIATQELENI